MSKILKFSRPSCAPCRTLETLLNEAEIEHEDINIDEHPNLIMEYGIRKVPTLVFLDEKGIEYNRTVGMTPIEKIKEITQ